jgi:hypothetical protein
MNADGKPGLNIKDSVKRKSEIRPEPLVNPGQENSKYSQSKLYPT